MVVAIGRIAAGGILISDPKILAHIETLREAIDDLEADIASRDTGSAAPPFDSSSASEPRS